MPQARVGSTLRTVYGGVAVTVPANKIATVLAIPGVVAVQEYSLHTPLTDSSSTFLGAPTIYNELGPTSNAGQGVIYGNLDTGIWPEHPSFADLGNLPAPPGPARECNFGDNPLTPAVDPFVCNDKLIGGAPFLDTCLVTRMARTSWSAPRARSAAVTWRRSCPPQTCGSPVPTRRRAVR